MVSGIVMQLIAVFFVYLYCKWFICVLHIDKTGLPETSGSLFLFLLINHLPGHASIYGKILAGDKG
jgi:hypothetical protein